MATAMAIQNTRNLDAMDQNPSSMSGRADDGAIPSPTKPPAKKQCPSKSGHRPSFSRDDRLAHHGGRSPGVKKKAAAAKKKKGATAAVSLLDPDSPPAAARKSPPPPPPGPIEVLSSGEDSPGVQAANPHPISIVNQNFDKHLVLQMQKAMNRKEVKDQVHSYGRDFLRDSMFKPLQAMRTHLISQARKVDIALGHGQEVLASHLHSFIPTKAPKNNTAKATMVSTFIFIWKALRHVLYHESGAISAQRMSTIESYVAFMERHEQLARAVLNDVANQDSNGKSMKPPPRRDGAWISNGWGNPAGQAPQRLPTLWSP